MQYLLELKEFLQFKHFIAEDVLTVFYVLSAILLPIFAWFFLLWVIRRYGVFIHLVNDGQYSIIYSLIMWIIRKIRFFQSKVDEKLSWQSFTLSQKVKFIALFTVIVVLSEIFLRLCFEYLIAFMQMHEWLKPAGIT